MPEAEGKIEALYKLVVTDKNGKVVSVTESKCKSFVKQFLQIIEAQMSPNVRVENIKEIAGTLHDCRNYEVNLEAEGEANDDTLGIILGTGTTPVANDDYVMETQITHGAELGQLNYGNTAKVTTTIVAGHVDFQQIRPFTNSSGATINVTEIGIYARFYDGSAYHDALILHDIVASTPILNGQTVTATITLRTTV